MIGASAQRIRERLSSLAAITEPGDGVTRIGYSQLENEAHALVASWLEPLGCAVSHDAAGNLVAERAGASQEEGAEPLGAIGTGSHLDSVPTGGSFDGIVGVVAAVEVAELLAAQHIATTHPFRFVAFRCEEGARFSLACIGSKLATGQLSREDLDRLTDVSGLSLATAMAQCDVDPDVAAVTSWDAAEWSSFIELHVEQGTILERTGQTIGVVEGISGSTRLELVITGVASHTGGTPMAGRIDALAVAAEVVLLIEHIANDPFHRGTRATVGRLQVEPNSMTTIPGMVKLAVDVRDHDADRQRATAEQIMSQAKDLVSKRGAGMTAAILADTSPVLLSRRVRQAVEDAAVAHQLSYRVMESGASHDSQNVATRMPAGMIFVPSKQGLSHVPQEWTDENDIAAGVDVLLAAMLNLDRSADDSAQRRVA